MNLPDFSTRHPLAYVVTATALAIVCYNMVPSGTLVGSLTATAIAAVCVLVVLAAADRGTLALRGKRAKRRSGRIGFTTVTLFAAAVVGAGALLSSDAAVPSLSSKTLVERVALLLALCLSTGVFEEGLFRGVVFKGLTRAFDQEGHGRSVLKAAVISSVLFGLLHATGSSACGSLNAVCLAQIMVKVLQASLFGFAMASTFMRSGNLWPAVAVHASFNLLCEAPFILLWGVLPTTYCTGSLADLAFLAISTALLVPVAFHAFAEMKHLKPSRPERR